MRAAQGFDEPLPVNYQRTKSPEYLKQTDPRLDKQRHRRPNNSDHQPAGSGMLVVTQYGVHADQEQHDHQWIWHEGPARQHHRRVKEVESYREEGGVG